MDPWHAGLRRVKPLPVRLRELPRTFDYAFTDKARAALIQTLFLSLANNDQEHLRLLFPQSASLDDPIWNLSAAQGAVEGAEYTAAAKGKRCGHIFQEEEATYSCKTCSADDTCVLCTKCFEASDHEGHQVYISLSPGSSGCCDCGDTEAWLRPVVCGIHTSTDSDVEQSSGPNANKGSATGKAPISDIPPDLRDSIQRTVGYAFDYLCDVFSCSPEHMRSPKQSQSIQRDEELARLVADWYGGPTDSEACKEYALVLWNDEKHTVDEVQEQVAKACRKTKAFGRQKAIEIDSVGRSVIECSKDLDQLLRMARVLEQIKVTVTIRSARDTFREQMCATIIEWLTDISGCSVGGNHDILMDTVCAEMLQPWHIGSNASNLSIAKQGLPDHEKSDNRLKLMQARELQNRVMAARMATRQARANIQIAIGEQEAPNPPLPGGVDDDDDDDEDDDEDTGGRREQGLDEMDLDEALAEAGAGVIEVEMTTAPQIGGAGGPEDMADLMSVGAISSPPDDSDGDPVALSPQKEPDELLSKTSSLQSQARPRSAPPGYWLGAGKVNSGASASKDLPLEENLEKRVRIDFLILYDLRMWKNLRKDIRHLYISTVIKVPRFKRILGLRFAAVYRVLAQLYLVADREPDHSIINLSLQMLTTPSITAEIIERERFFTTLLAVLYTFLTTRQVGGPENVDLTAGMAFESGVMTNRRVHHFFGDMKYLLESKFVREKIRDEDDYLLQLLDFIKLCQGVSPNVRAVGEHIEYESDAWMSAGIVVRDVTRLVCQFCEAFEWDRSQDPSSICRAIRQTAKTAIINSTGAEAGRFSESELKGLITFKTLEASECDKKVWGAAARPYRVPDFEVEKRPMSFHHGLHYMLSWLVDNGKSMTKDQLRGLLTFSPTQLATRDWRSNVAFEVPTHEPEEYLLALFDVPLRVCAWLAQMKAGMWVRNGVTLRHQMATFRSVLQRDVSSQRDFFLLQVALIICPPEAFLASMIDRFGMWEWVSGSLQIKDGWEDHQMMDLAEDLIHLLIVLLSDRTLLMSKEQDPTPSVSIAKRDIIHALCLKPLSHSDLSDRLTHKILNLDNLDLIIHEVATYKPPDGLSDSGVFELKDKYFDEVDPYNAYYSKNQREEAENAWRARKAKSTGEPVSDTVFDPCLPPITSGVFKDLGVFSQTPLFCQVILGSLNIACHASKLGNLPATRVEAFLPVVLHLLLIAIAEDRTSGSPQRLGTSFIDTLLATRLHAQQSDSCALSMLFKLLTGPHHEASKSKIRFILRRLQQRRSQAFENSANMLNIPLATLHLDDERRSASAQDLLEKKRKALERQAKVMASFKQQQSAFMENQNQNTDFSPDDWSDVGSDLEMTDSNAPKTWQYPRDTCIFCQEDTSEQRLYGTLAYINKSKLFRITDVLNEDHLQEIEMTPLSLDKPMDDLRPFGIARCGVQKVVRKTEDGRDTSSYERRTLGQGWSPSDNSSGPVVTGCGHVMHYSCFEAFSDATSRRHQFQIARNHPERLLLKEFVCPLCKALGNTFMPIIWKPKPVLNQASTNPGSFDQWLTAQAPFLISRMSDEDVYRRACARYTSEAIVPSYASQVTLPGTGPSTNHSHGQGPSLWHTMPAFLSGGPQVRLRETTTRRSAESPSPQRPSTELLNAYQRLQSTLYANRLPQHMDLKVSGELAGSQTLARALGYSISAVEIALRGVAGDPDSTLIDKVPQQSLVHLKTLSETCSSYAALNLVHSSTQTAEVPLRCRQQVFQLFGDGNSEVFDNALTDTDTKKAPLALLNIDAFVFLTQCSCFMVPYLHLDIAHVLRLCCTLEIVKVVLACLDEPDMVNKYANSDLDARTDHQGQEAEKEKSRCSHQQSENFSVFVQSIIGETKKKAVTHDVRGQVLSGVEENPNARMAFDTFVRSTALTYLLTFSRKCLLLMHVRVGVDYSGIEVDPSATEYERLTQLLGIPTLDGIVDSINAQTQTAKCQHKLISHWIEQWIVSASRSSGPDDQQAAALSRLDRREVAFNEALRFDEAMRIIMPSFPGAFPDTNLTVPGRLRQRTENIEIEGRWKLRLSHPGIYELVALPHAHDTLNAAALAKRCPSKGGPLNDPCLCLMCGDLFCGQAACCAVESPPGSGLTQGGCYRHQAKCGGTIGMFLNIRRCAVLFLNGKHGSFFPAPYLDVHGETDYGLKRKGRLYLEPKRYEKLYREVWLSHGVPSAISRRLEADVNTGGWETT